MGNPVGFKQIPRQMPHRRPVELRLLDWNEVYQPSTRQLLRDQGARCMDCGIPFCHNGCPLGNIIPEWNDLVYKDRWKDALDMLFKTNNFPEFTGRVCPAPCEEACVLNINEKPVTIKLIEQSIIDTAFANGYIKPEPPDVRADRVGGLLTYGIPNFKLEKHVVDRRIKLMEAEGITFRTNANVGINVKVEDLRRDFDAIVLCGGATAARELNVPGRELGGIYKAMDYLTPANKACLGDNCAAEYIDAKDKHVIILGGGDTGADCLGTALRQGAKSIKQFELLPRPPEARSSDAVKEGILQPWPYWPMTYRVSSAHEEATHTVGGGQDVRDYAINTQRFSGDAGGNVRKLHAVRLEWNKDPAGRWQMKEVPGS